METKVFSDDAIQRIASGNETTQTRISLDVLKKVLNPKQMRNVLGGSGDDQECWHRCYYWGMNGEQVPTASVWGFCYEARSECSKVRHEIDCYC